MLHISLAANMMEETNFTGEGRRFIQGDCRFSIGNFSGMAHSFNLSASLFASAVALWFLQVVISLIAGKKCNHKFSSLFFMLPCIALFISALTSWNNPCYFEATSSVFRFGNEKIVQHLDGLSAIFLGLLSFVGLSVAFFSTSYLEQMKDRIHSGFYWSALAILMLSMALVFTSTNAVAFLVFWELMSLSSLSLVVSEHKFRRVQKAGLIYMGATRVATALVAGGFLWLFATTHSWNISQWTLSTPALLPSALILAGLCIKAGSWPFHLWLPYAYPAAPSPVSAVLSGVMSNVAVYAIVRILIGHELCPLLLGHVMLGLGVLSAFWGVLFAFVESDIKRLLAYSSVENIGLILMGLGLCVLAQDQGLHILALFGLSSALFQAINHGLYKPLLFLSAGAVDISTNARDLSQLGGLIRKMPWTAAFFLTGSAAICAFPPLNGFASKFLLYQGFLQSSWVSNSLMERFLGLMSVGTLALVGGLAVATFTKAMGIAFLGNPRNKSAFEHASDGSKGMLFAQGMLLSACLTIGLAPSFFCEKLQTLSCEILKIQTPAENLFHVPMPVFVLSFLIVFSLAYFVFLKGSQTREFKTWDCGFGELSSRTQASAASFAQPVAHIFSNILRFKLLIEIRGRDRRNFPEHIKVEPEMISILETRIYKPTIHWIIEFSKVFSKLQAGSIHLYLLYVCATLVVLVLIGTQL